MSVVFYQKIILVWVRVIIYGLSEIDTDYAFILNPDVVLKNDTIDEIINASKKIDAFSIISPIMEDEKYPNYKMR